jgi:hypothetical protein
MSVKEDELLRLVASLIVQLILNEEKSVEEAANAETLNVEIIKEET